MISSKGRLLERGMPIHVSIVLSLQNRQTVLLYTAYSIGSRLVSFPAQWSGTQSGAKNLINVMTRIMKFIVGRAEA